MSTPWHEDDSFWEECSEFLFGPERWASVAIEVNALIELASPVEGARVLDLCCGPGRHALELARRGYSVTAVDRTAHYLARARSSADAENLEVEWVEEDMRRFVRPSRFDLATNLFTSFGYFEDPDDDLQVARNLFSSLRPAGCLVMDLMGKEVLARIFQPRVWHWVDEARGIMVLEERELSPDWGWMSNTWSIVRDREPVKHHTFSHRIYSGTELKALLRRAGFERVDLFGSLEGSRYDHEASRLVAVALRPE